jgi:hypothetical protein
MMFALVLAISLIQGYRVFVGGLFVMGLYLCVRALLHHTLGMRARFDRHAQRITIKGAYHTPLTLFPPREGFGLHYDLAEVAAVQFCDSGIEWGESSSWHSYQLNLVFRNRTPERVNLLDNGGQSELLIFAREIAKFLEVPLYIGANICSDSGDIELAGESQKESG